MGIEHKTAVTPINMAVKLIVCCVCVFPIVTSFLFGDMDTVHIYVSPAGSDSNPGEPFKLIRRYLLNHISYGPLKRLYLIIHGHEVSHPLKTISRAVNLLNRQDVQGKQVFIELLNGYHDLLHTVYINRVKASNVTIRSYNQQEVHITGGKRISPNLLTAVTDQHILSRIPSNAHGKVKQVRLSDAGMTDLGHMSSYGFHHQRTAPLEIFFNGKPLRLARWPNEGNGYVNIASLVDGKDGDKFKYSGTRASRWIGEPDVWAHGFWYWSWADYAIKIDSIDINSKVITLENKPRFGLRTGYFNLGHNYQHGFKQQGGYYRIINALSELDEPGEYYIDRTSGILYMWAPNSAGSITSQDIIYGSMITDCFSLHNAANVVFDGFTIEACRRNAFLLQSVRHITFQKLEIKNTGSYNIKCANCNNTVMSACSLHDGDGGIKISGGNRATLTSSDNVIEHNHIWSYSREGVVGYSAIAPGGVGIHIHHNEMHDGQYSAVIWGGNDHVMEYNHVHHNCMNASDCGGLHTGGDWTSRGNVIRYNHVHHHLRLDPGADVRGIMLDDQSSSVDIYENVFYHNDVQVNIGGGRDNYIRKNIFFDAVRSSMQMDARGLHHDPEKDNALNKGLHSVPYHGSLWRGRYPKLASIDSESSAEPRGNQIIQNIFYNSNNNTVMFNGLTSPASWFNITQIHTSVSKYDFTSPETEDFRPRCGLTSYVNAVHFPTPVPISKVGPQLPVGPSYLQRGSRVVHSQTASSQLHPCPSTKPPVKTVPRVSYLPDGTRPNTLYSVQNQGCWFRIEKCPNHPNLAGNSHDPSSYLHRDTDGEQHLHTGTNETACLERVPYMVNRCGSASSFSVIYGPTGAMTLGGAGCYFAQYPCPKHGIQFTGFIRDGYAESQLNAAHNEHNCLARARSQWTFCGSNVSSPITSIYKPTGHISTAGGGCWLRVTKCPADISEQTGLFYDAFGAANFDTDHVALACFQRASDIWIQCGQHSEYPVIAYFRPTATTRIINS